MMLSLDSTEVIAIVHTHVIQYLSNVDLINFKIALPRGYNFYLSDNVMERILTRMLARKGVTVCTHCVNLVNLPKPHAITLVQTFHKIIQDIVCCYDHDSFQNQMPNIYYSKHSAQSDIFSYAETKLCMTNVSFINPSFANMIGNIEAIETENDNLVFVYYSTDRTACITLPVNITCEWCTNCDEGHYNTAISVSGHRNFLYCQNCDISFCGCSSDYVMCAKCDSVWCYTCDNDGVSNGEICCSDCGRFICGSCMVETSDSHFSEDDESNECSSEQSPLSEAGDRDVDDCEVVIAM